MKLIICSTTFIFHDAKLYIFFFVVSYLFFYLFIPFYLNRVAPSVITVQYQGALYTNALSLSLSLSLNVKIIEFKFYVTL